MAFRHDAQGAIAPAFNEYATVTLLDVLRICSATGHVPTRNRTMLQEPGGVYTTLIVEDRNRMIYMIIFFNTIWIDCQTG